MSEEEIVRDGTRRIVGREALRRLSRMVRGWQEEEREKHELARRLAIGLALVAAVLLATFFIRHF